MIDISPIIRYNRVTTAKGLEFMRITKLVLSLVLAALLLAGCVATPQPGPSGSTAATQPSTAPTETTPPATEPEKAPCAGHDSDPYQGVDKEAFYADYTPACCYVDAQYRTAHFLLSGLLEVPGQYVTEAEQMPKDGDRYIRNTASTYLDDGNTYVIYDSNGKEFLRIYKGAGYITLEEVAAYMYAFGGSSDSIPANYTSKKTTKPGGNPWGKYLRSNHSYFKGDTKKYPYEPKLPNISGCGGDLQYYEMDIGTTGTETPGYAPHPYNDGTSITRGAARLVYARQDLNKNGVYEDNEIYVFYTHNHYNDFREYLNYYGGWGQMFGNITGGGTLSSKTDYNPTPYPETAYDDFTA